MSLKRPFVGELPNWVLPIADTARRIDRTARAHGVNDLTAHNAHKRRTPEAIAATEDKARRELAKAERLLMIRQRFNALRAREVGGAPGPVCVSGPGVTPQEVRP